MKNYFIQFDRLAPYVIAIASAVGSLLYMGPAGAGWAATALATLITLPAHGRVIYFTDIKRPYIAALIMQYLHIFEEWQTNFAGAFPPGLGYAPWQHNDYMIMTGVNLAIVTVGLIPLLMGTRIGTYVACFMALLGIVNGIAHPILAILFADGWYFSGLITAVPHLALGFWLWHALRDKPAPDDGPALPLNILAPDAPIPATPNPATPINPTARARDRR